MNNQIIELIKTFASKYNTQCWHSYECTYDMVYNNKKTHEHYVNDLQKGLNILLDNIVGIIGDTMIFIQIDMSYYDNITKIYTKNDMINKYPYLEHFPDFFNNIKYIRKNICVLDDNENIKELNDIEDFRNKFKVLGPSVFENNNIMYILSDKKCAL